MRPHLLLAAVLSLSLASCAAAGHVTQGDLELLRTDLLLALDTSQDDQATAVGQAFTDQAGRADARAAKLEADVGAGLGVLELVLGSSVVTGLGGLLLDRLRNRRRRIRGEAV